MGMFRDFLAEVFVHRTSENAHTVIAFRSDIWLLHNDEQRKDVISGIWNSILAQHPGRVQLRQSHKDPQDVHDLKELVNEYIPDALVGQIYDKTLWFDTDVNKAHPLTSTLAKKVAQALKVRSAHYSIEDNDAKVSVKKMTGGGLPEMFYHGTSSAYLERIFATGLRAGASASNWMSGDIEHPETIFFTAQISEAMFHANRTAHGRENSASAGVPIVIAFRLPDPALLIPDYDVDRVSSRKHYEQKPPKDDPNFTRTAMSSVDSWKLARQSGTFGYKGRIPPAFFEYILVYSEQDNKWNRISKRSFRAMLKKIEDWGLDTFEDVYGPKKPRYY
jgi:hypothetical protein